MAVIASPSSSSLHFSSNPFPYSSSAATKKVVSRFNFSVRASDSDSNIETEITETEPSSPPPPESDNFDNRLAQVRLRYRSGTGTKAEVRKGKKPTKKGGSGSGSGSVFLPPIPLKEPASGGVKVEFGFSPYTERINGRLAGLGLAALLLVELASGKSVIRYHTPPIIFLQVYTVAAICAVFIKFEKESVSLWPQSSPSASTDNQSK